MRLLRAGVTYFALVFAAGFILGIVRQVVLVPVVGATAAVAVEAPVILAVSALVARWSVNSFAAKSSDAIAIGAIALAFLLVTEAVLAGPVRGWSLAQWLGHFSTSDGALSLALYLAFAAMPWLVGRRNPGRH